MALEVLISTQEKGCPDRSRRILRRGFWLPTASGCRKAKPQVAGPGLGWRVWNHGLLGLWLSCAWVCGQTALHTIVTNGPASNRVNLVLISEGYTAGQLPWAFLSDATNAADVLLSTQPYSAYRQHFNVFAIAVPSDDSGSDHPNSSLYRDTHFNSTYDGADYFITIPPNWADQNYEHGQGKVDALLQTYLVGPTLPVLLVNDSVTGGSDGGGNTAIVSTSPNALNDFLVHESGHVFAGLGDEYTWPYPGYPDVEEPNTTRETNRAAIKWNAWISPATPVPTPATAPYAGVVGLFEGAHYQPTGWYRPKLNCRMRSLGVPFCEVCSEAIVLSIHRRVRPIETRSPAITNLSATTPQPLAFDLTLLQPTTNMLAIRWLTNGVPVPGATNPTLMVPPTLLGNGNHSIVAEVTDTTPLVRNDPANSLAQAVGWQVTVSLPELRLMSPQWMAPDSFAFSVTGVAAQPFAIQGSSDLSNWLALHTNTLTGGQYRYTNQNGGGFPNRFFRAITPP